MPSKNSQKMIKEIQKEPLPFAFKISSDVISIDESASVRSAAQLLAQHNIGAAIAKTNDVAVGIVSERDIVYKVVAEGKSYDNLSVKDIMTGEMITVNIDDGLNVIHEQIKKHPFRHLPVRKGDQIVGMISNRDLKYLRKLKLVHSDNKK